ncbi:hypothetical protein ACW2Q0_27300 [Nocardia sp. R16R-3T]
MGGGILLVVSLLAWAVKYLLGREHRWSWKVATVPLVVLAGLVAGLVFPPASFDSARPELEKVAVEMLREDRPNTRQDVSLGGLDISLAHRPPDGRVYFYDAVAVRSIDGQTIVLISPNDRRALGLRKSRTALGRRFRPDATRR